MVLGLGLLRVYSAGFYGEGALRFHVSRSAMIQGLGIGSRVASTCFLSHQMRFTYCSQPYEITELPPCVSSALRAVLHGAVCSGLMPP